MAQPSTSLSYSNKKNIHKMAGAFNSSFTEIVKYRQYKPADSDY